jgi:drug/metabolite transporter (DMT)-like permease
MQQDDRYRLTGLVLAVVGTILFGAKGIVMKLALAEGASVEQMMALRMGFSLPVFLIVGFLSFRKRSVRPEIKTVLIAAGLGIMSYHICTWLDFQGLRYTSAQLERLILFTYPTIVAVLAWVFLKDRLTVRHALSLLLSYAGVFLLFGRELSNQGGHVAFGSALVFVAAILFAIYVTASKGIITRLGAALFTSVAMSAAAFSIIIHSGITVGMGNMPAFSPLIFIYGVILAVFCTAMPSFMLSEAIGRLGPGPTSAIGNVGPVATSVLAVLVLGESFGWPHALALALTSIGIGLLSTGRKPKPAAGQLLKNT